MWGSAVNEVLYMKPYPWFPEGFLPCYVLEGPKGRSLELKAQKNNGPEKLLTFPLKMDGGFNSFADNM